MDKSRAARRVGRRGLLVGTLAGAGLTAAAAAAWSSGDARPRARPSSGPVLYRRTPEVERYYKTLYW